MGNLLSEPVTDIHGVSGTFDLNSTKKYRYSLSHMQGWRPKMEDAHIFITSIPSNDELKLPEIPDISFFAVFDGHGGVMSSNFAEKNFIPVMQTSIIYSKLVNHTINYTDTNEYHEKLVNILKDLIQDTIILLDKKLRILLEEQKASNGTTAVFAFVTGRNIVCGNLGDSRGLFCKENNSSTAGFEYFVTKDHKPNDNQEKKRIEAGGLYVANNRICYDLALSRALGDFDYKNVGNLSPFDQPVSISCDVYVWERDDSELFLCLACDGIWDVLSNGQVCDFILTAAKQGKSLKQITDDITKKCLQSEDNMSVIIVTFKEFGKNLGNPATTDDAAVIPVTDKEEPSLASM